MTDSDAIKARFAGGLANGVSVTLVSPATLRKEAKGGKGRKRRKRFSIRALCVAVFRSPGM